MITQMAVGDGFILFLPLQNTFSFNRHNLGNSLFREHNMW